MSEIARVSKEELAAEGITALPDKEVLSLLDLNANLDLALDAAAPIDLAVGANANIAAPINAAVGANVLSPLAVSESGGTQAAEIHQGIVGDATATAPQDSSIAQGDPTSPGVAVGSIWVWALSAWPSGLALRLVTSSAVPSPTSSVMFSHLQHLA